jgi:NAD(P)-dependent dehydrogenase (short-subunit alcohol dehydrogenase family)
MDLRIEDRLALVTGASRGIGRATARELALRGCDLVLVARNLPRLTEVAASIRDETGRSIRVIGADLRHPEEIQRIAEAVGRTDFGLDILINNAGATKPGDVFALTDDDWADGFALKFYGYMRMTRALWPLLVERRGVIVNVIGTSAMTPAVDFAIGGAVNAAVANFTKGLAERGIVDGVRVNAVHPGPVLTERLEALLDFQARQTTVNRSELDARIAATNRSTGRSEVEDCANLIAFLVSPLAKQIVGASITIDGGLTKSL